MKGLLNKLFYNKEESKQTVQSVKMLLNKLKEDIVRNDRPVIDLINSVRLGTIDYDFDGAISVNGGGQADILEIKSNIDGNTYVCKVYKFDMVRADIDKLAESGAERDISILLCLEHDSIPHVVDIVKDKIGNPCIIMEKCN